MLCRLCRVCKALSVNFIHAAVLIEVAAALDLRCCGNPANGGNCSFVDFSNFSGISDVYSTGYAFMVLNKTTGAARCWGDSDGDFLDFGGNCSGMDFSGVTDVYSNTYAFMALNKDTGAAQCWGRSDSGGNCSSMNFSGVTDVYNTEWAFMALNKDTGDAQCWGSNGRFSGDCSYMFFSGVTDVYSIDDGFMALNKKTGYAQAWGDVINGCGASGGVVAVYSTKGAFTTVMAPEEGNRVPLHAGPGTGNGQTQHSSYAHAPAASRSLSSMILIASTFWIFQ
eukprot:TRINITY_DN18831_c0_g1_i1.p1 TRINITY_DN18831_c0_g1~~TRINITY_DN18831_c0_g1_i1.p1  ORF type:complete len:300 (-),score=44.74 TRINITY_DN18831_c0_g1_i1:107-949(-)